MDHLSSNTGTRLKVQPLPQGHQSGGKNAKDPAQERDSLDCGCVGSFPEGRAEARTGYGRFLWDSISGSWSEGVESKAGRIATCRGVRVVPTLGSWGWILLGTVWGAVEQFQTNFPIN